MDEASFWEIMDLLDWEHEGDDERVCASVIEALAARGDDAIFAFDEIRSRLLYDIDGEAWYDEAARLSGDSFLYARCVAIVNGRAYYEDIKSGRKQLDPDLEFEAVLYLPEQAWARRHGKDEDGYPHVAKYSYESFSNTAMWPHLQG